MGRVIVTVVLLMALAVPAGAEHEIGLSLAPVFEIPPGNDRFSPGMGAAAALDWAFLPFLGISAEGGFSSLSTGAGSAFTLYRGGLGPFFRWRPLDRWSFRGGIRAGFYQYRWGDLSNTRLFAGGGLQAELRLLPSLSLYAGGDYVFHGFTESPLNTITIAAGIRLYLSEIMGGEARVRGEMLEERRIFPVSYAWYRDNPVAMLRITNEEPNSITALRLSLFMDSYMGQPELFAVIPSLAPGESAELPVTALFNEAMLSLTENVGANGRTLLSYRSLGARKEAEFPALLPIYHRNAMSWDDDRRAASFVSPRDPAARLFARYVASVVDMMSENRAHSLPRNLRYAAALFEALAAYGVNYVIDPASSFVELSENASAVDSLNYPYQTLYYRGGDCDDLSILYCSLLEVLGVDTAFITIPGHIYMAFDVGDDSWEREGLIEEAGRLWMPVEITLPDEGFYLAWRVGAREWRSAGEVSPGAEGNPAGDGLAGDGRRLYPMKESWAIYPPVSVPAAGDALPEMMDERAFVEAFERELGKLGAFGR